MTILWPSNPQWLLDGRLCIHIGDVHERLEDMPDECIDVVVSSPPYWLVRNYGVRGQLGLEHSLSAHIGALVDVFESLRRVLKPHATIWLNYGDGYAADANGRSADDTKRLGNDDRTFRDKPGSSIGNGRLGPDVLGHSFASVIDATKGKDLLLIPAVLAIALRAAGWYIRSEIIWGKDNPIPDSSGTGRPSVSYEKVFLITKSADADVWRARDTGEISFHPDHSERCSFNSKRDPETGKLAEGATRWIRLGAYYDARTVLQPSSGNTHPRHAAGSVPKAGPKVGDRALSGRNNPSHNAALNSHRDAGTRLLRNFEPAPVSAWRVKSKAFKDAHFATFPPELVALALQAGSPVDGVVLDPFGGAGTTALVALRMGRRAHMIELKPEYAHMARQRIERDWMGEEERALAEGKDRHDALKAEGKLEPLPLLREAAE